MTYAGVALGALPLLIATGLFYLFPEALPEQVLGLGGVWPVAVLHYVIALFLTVFLVGHVYMATFGETLTSDLKMMVTGWHVPHAHAPKGASPETEEGSDDPSHS